jgi:hypothetical protein
MSQRLCRGRVQDVHESRGAGLGPLAADKVEKLSILLHVMPLKNVNRFRNRMVVTGLHKFLTQTFLIMIILMLPIGRT